MGATASAVTKALKAAGLTMSEWIGSGRIRGSGSSTEGLMTEAVKKFDYRAGARFPTGEVTVKYTPGSWSVQGAGDARAARLARAAEALTAKGYTVEQKTSQYGTPYLSVTKED